jgi:hypothetical protein
MLSMLIFGSMAAGEACSFPNPPCDPAQLARGDLIANVFLAITIVAIVGSFVGAMGAALAWSARRAALILLVVSTGLLLAAGLVILILSVRATSDDLILNVRMTSDDLSGVAYLFFIVAVVLGGASLVLYGQSRAQAKRSKAVIR